MSYCSPLWMASLVSLVAVFISTETSFGEDPAAVPGSNKVNEMRDTPLWTLSAEQRSRCEAILRTGLQSDMFWPSIHAAEGLTLAGYGAEVVTALKPRLLQERDDQRRCGLARELVRAGRDEYADVLTSILAGDNPHGHVHAAESLFKVHRVAEGGVMQQAFGDTANPPLRVMAAAAMARAGDAAALRFLREHVREGELSSARLAAWALARVGDAQDIAPMRRRLDRINRTDDGSAIYFFEHALAVLAEEAGQAALLTNLASDDVAVRTSAAEFSGEARVQAAKPLLLDLLNDDNLDTRLRAAQSLLVHAGLEKR